MLLRQVQGVRAAGGSLSGAQGVVYAVRSIEQRGYELLDVRLAYETRHGVDLVFRKGSTFAIVEAKAGKTSLSKLVTDTQNLRQGSMDYNENRLLRYLDSKAPEHAVLARTLLAERSAGRLESYATFYRGGSVFELPAGWPLLPAIRR